LPPELPREEEIMVCPEAACTCPQCQGKRKVIGYEISERLDCHPARYFVKVTKREKVACPQCEEAGVATAPLRPQIIPKGIASNGVVVDVLLSKYEMHLPLYRQELQISRRSGIELSRQTMCDWMMECGFLLQSVCRALHQDLLRGGYIQADETPIGVHTKEKKGRNHQGYIWEYSRPGGPVIFDYQNGRSREGPQKMLHPFRGILQTDDYSVYGSLRLAGVQLAACMAHVRRKFVEAVRIHPSDQALIAIVAKIGALYGVEREAREKNLSEDERRKLRQIKSAPLLGELKISIVAMRQEVLPQSLPGKACDYALGLWGKLEVYLSHGQIEIDNNICENAIRPLALGRKNWLHFGSKQAGPKIAAILSVIETCHRLKVPVREYLLDVLPKLSTGKIQDVVGLTPMAWQHSR
jgi:transposase